MNDELVERLSQYVENFIDYCLSVEGIEIFQAEVFNKYPYSEFLPWIRSLPDSPVKQAMLNQAEVYARLLVEHSTSRSDPETPTLDQNMDNASSS